MLASQLIFTVKDFSLEEPSLFAIRNVSRVPRNCTNGTLKRILFNKSGQITKFLTVLYTNKNNSDIFKKHESRYIYITSQSWVIMIIIKWFCMELTQRKNLCWIPLRCFILIFLVGNHTCTELFMILRRTWTRTSI